MRDFYGLHILPDESAHAEITAHLDSGGDPRAHTNAALRWVCERGRLDLLERLISLDLDNRDARVVDNYALRWACANGHLAVVSRLIELGLTADDARANNNHALRAACRDGHLDVVNRLLDLGLDADDARADDNYALYIVCNTGHLAVFNRLIELGLGLEDVRNFDAVEIASLLRHGAIVARLLELGAEPTPAALRALTAYARVGDDERDARLRRAIERWRDTPELDAAAAELAPFELELWKTVRVAAQPCRRFAD